MYPLVRMRRNRKAGWVREILAETIITPADLILPIFIIEGSNKLEEIKHMPGVYRQSIDQLIITAKNAYALGIKAIALFPCVQQDLKSTNAYEAYNLDNLICRAIRSLRNSGVDIGIICDVALDPYTSHGHDGILGDDNNVDNDITIEALSNQALVLAKAGADIVAPSDMMDGRIKTIRQALDAEGFINVSILSYAVKYASSFYAPFRSAIGSKQNVYLDKATYQMDIRNIKEAMREVKQDIQEGADMILIKPALPFLDVIHKVSNKFDINVLGYQVSGEYSMLKLAALADALDWRSSMMESLVAIKRAGASAIFTYAALEFAKKIN